MTQRKINVVLDLDNTLISAIDEEEKNSINPTLLKKYKKIFYWKDMGEYTVFARPYLQDFLKWLFANVNVSIWTAASNTYATFIIQEFIRANKSDRKLDYVLHSHHCRESKRKRKYQKVLSMMDDEYPIGYDLDHTYIVDDHSEVHRAQPKKCIRVVPFDVLRPGCERDIGLLNVMEKLKTICNS